MDLNNTINMLWTNAVAPSTRCTYQTAFHIYVKFLLSNAITCISEDFNLQWGLEWWISLSTVNSALPQRKLGTQHSRLSIEKKQFMTNWMTADVMIYIINTCQTHSLTDNLGNNDNTFKNQFIITHSYKR